MLIFFIITSSRSPPTSSTSSSHHHRYFRDHHTSLSLCSSDYYDVSFYLNFYVGIIPGRELTLYHLLVETMIK